MIDLRLEEYIEGHTTPESELLYELRRKTFLHTPYPRMLSGPVQGRFMSMISRMVNPSRILEIGTFTGYSAICLAQGLAEGGLLHTIESDSSYADIAGDYFSRAGMERQIRLHEGDALEIIPRLDEIFDLVFIDADKEQYPEYYRLVFDKIRNGGYLLADNTLWDGKVLEKGRPGDVETRGIVEFNRMIQEDVRVENVLLSIRDGISLIRKI